MKMSLIDDTMDVEGQTRQLVDEYASPPPPAMTEEYIPGADGMLTKRPIYDRGLTPIPREGVAPGGEQARLQELEDQYPGGVPGPALTGPMLTSERLGGVEYNLPAGGYGEAISGAALRVPSIPEGAFPGIGGAPVYKLPPELQSQFDDILKQVIEPSETLKTLRLQAQGFGLPAGETSRGRALAIKSLGTLEANRTNAIASLVGSITRLMIEPNKFYERQFERLLTHGERIGELGLKGRELGFKREALATRERALAEAPAKTIKTLGPEGTERTLQWDKASQSYIQISEGAKPRIMKEGEKLVSGTTGEILAGEEKGLPRTQMAQTAFRQNSSKKQPATITNMRRRWSLLASARKYLPFRAMKSLRLITIRRDLAEEKKTLKSCMKQT